MDSGGANKEFMKRALVDYLGSLGLDAGQFFDLVRLTGGASRETWMLTLADRGEACHQLVLRRDPPEAADPVRMGREAAALRAAKAAGVPVPQLFGHSTEQPCDEIGSSFLLMEKLPGEALPQKLLRDDRYTAVRATLPYELGRTLARIHDMNIEEVDDFPCGDQLDQLFEQYLESGPPAPALEVAFAWLRGHPVIELRKTVVHGDFRNGNILVDESGIRGVLDWELVHLGDPMEDLGWLCVKTWRFGCSEPVGGFGSRADLFRGYEDESGVPPDAEAVHWWEIYGTLRWAVMCRIQANRALVQREGNTLELLAIGRRIAECEKDLLGMIGADAADSTTDALLPIDAADVEDLFGRPTIDRLLFAVKSFVRDEPSNTDQSRYLARVASNVLDMAIREAKHGNQLRSRHQQLLAECGMNNEAELALALRNGSREISDPASLKCIRQAVSARLAIANPRY
jgi:aminoglycoside phosphotransferase (APT) family kinase protein